MKRLSALLFALALASSASAQQPFTQAETNASSDLTLGPALEEFRIGAWGAKPSRSGAFFHGADMQFGFARTLDPQTRRWNSAGRLSVDAFLVKDHFRAGAGPWISTRGELGAQITAGIQFNHALSLELVGEEAFGRQAYGPGDRRAIGLRLRLD